MKRMLAILLALLLAAPCALAQKTYAATQVETDLLAAPHEHADVLMRYYIGTRVEVIREADDTYVQVNVGDEGGSLMGYMEKRKLVLGEENIRSVQAERVHIRGAETQTCRLYSYPDKLAPVLDEQFNISVRDVWGYRGDKWLHVKEYKGTTGFVARDELEGESVHIDDAPYIHAEPMEGELTREEAIAFARETILGSEDPAQFSGTPGVQITEEGLSRCSAECDLLYYFDTPGTVQYSVVFREPVTGYIYAGVDFLAQGKDIVTISSGNG